MIAAAIVPATAAGVGVVAVVVMLVGDNRLYGVAMAAAGATVGPGRLRRTRSQANWILLSSRLLDIHDCLPTWSWTSSGRLSQIGSVDIDLSQASIRSRPA